MKKWIKIVLLVLLILVLIITIILNSQEKFHYTNKILFGKLSNNVIYDEVVSMDIDTISINIDEGIINIINSDTDDISIKIKSDRNNLEYKTFNKRLSVVTEERKMHLFPIMNVIDIYLPSNYPGVINIINDHGHTNIGEFEYSSIYITNKMGNAKVDKCNVLNLKNKYGDNEIGISNIINSNNMFGDIKINEVNSVNMNNKLGNASINAINEYSDIDIVFGNVTIKKITITKDSSVSSSCGDISITEYNKNEFKLDTTAVVGDTRIDNIINNE